MDCPEKSTCQWKDQCHHTDTPEYCTWLQQRDGVFRLFGMTGINPPIREYITRMRIRVCPDFNSTGLWDEDNGGVMLEYEDLDIPQYLIDDFKDWIRYYSDRCHEHDKYTFIPGMGKVLNERGLALALHLKTLKPHLVILFWGEDEDGIWDPKEIKLNDPPRLSGKSDQADDRTPEIRDTADA
jgi:hypothetical protein